MSLSHRDTGSLRLGRGLPARGGVSNTRALGQRPWPRCGSAARASPGWLRRHSCLLWRTAAMHGAVWIPGRIAGFDV